MNDKFIEILGYPGRLLSGSKLSYSQAHPANTVFFNACIFDESEQQVWYGDLDLTLESEKLQELANAVGTLYVTKELPFRFAGLAEGRKNKPEAVKVFNKKDDQ